MRGLQPRLAGVGESRQGWQTPVRAGEHGPNRPGISPAARFRVAVDVPVGGIETGPLAVVVSGGQR
ncbi:MAG: hypothetical protein ACYDBH_12095 [Acidobacteriaceae bacterium]